LIRLVQTAPSLECFGQRMVALSVLARVAVSSETSSDNAPRIRAGALHKAMERFEGWVVVRPDGYLANMISGKAIRKIGELRGTDQGFFAGHLPVGIPHVSDGGLLRPVQRDGSVGKPVGEARGLEHDLANRALDGAENSVVAVVDGVIAVLTDPAGVVNDAARLARSIRPADEVAAWLIENVPDYVERFQAKPLGDQVEDISTVISNLMTMYLLSAPVSGLVDEAAKIRMFPWFSAEMTPAGALALEFGFAAVPAQLVGAIEAGGLLGASGLLFHSTTPIPADIDASRAAAREHYGSESLRPNRQKKTKTTKPNPGAEHWRTAESFRETIGDLDLKVDEARGGHLIEKHVGKDKKYLQERLDEKPNADQMSTFNSELEASRAVRQALRENSLKVAEWLAGSPDDILRIKTSSFEGGTVLSRSGKMRSGQGARIILLGDGAGGWIVYTGYPI
ncbi:MAG: RNase A-like domain-containing protein, partial [Myxococcota bacterium]